MAKFVERSKVCFSMESSNSLRNKDCLSTRLWASAMRVTFFKDSLTRADLMELTWLDEEDLLTRDLDLLDALLCLSERERVADNCETLSSGSMSLSIGNIPTPDGTSDMVVVLSIQAVEYAKTDFNTSNRGWSHSPNEAKISKCPANLLSNSSWVSTIKAMYWCNSTEYSLTGSRSELSLLRRGISLFTTLFAALIAEAHFPRKFLSSSPKPFSFSFRWRLDMFTFKYNRPTPGGHQRNSAPCSSKYTHSMWKSTMKICTVTQHNKAQRCWTKSWFINSINITCIFIATTGVCDEIMSLTNDTDAHKISSSSSAHSRWRPMTSRRNIQHCRA